jgi:hypothetical protein
MIWAVKIQFKKNRFGTTMLSQLVARMMEQNLISRHDRLRRTEFPYRE